MQGVRFRQCVGGVTLSDLFLDGGGWDPRHVVRKLCDELFLSILQCLLRVWGLGFGVCGVGFTKRA
jgi:hypothetical protein